MGARSPGIIGVTGWAGERCRRQSSEAGIDLVLLKPIAPSLMETLLMGECRRANRRSRLLEEANA